ncbi:hypothetical protein OIO90_006188 [Microbotryomycetes sp. JL221]|nr:hypothetical protein OIO90_006188 [Microbotryomycetes sp. JL221]
MTPGNGASFHHYQDPHDVLSHAHRQQQQQQQQQHQLHHVANQYLSDQQQQQHPPLPAPSQQHEFVQAFGSNTSAPSYPNTQAHTDMYGTPQSATYGYGHLTSPHQQHHRSSVLAQAPQTAQTTTAAGHQPLRSDSPAAAASSILSMQQHQQQQQQQQQQHSSPAATPRQDSPAVASSSGAPTAKSRSAMACVLCRKQKMKCEGPDKAPCKRCRTAGVECVFEAAPPVAPRVRGSGLSEGYVESRFASVEERLTHLEDSSTSRPAMTQQNGGFITDHERRIAALEAQVYALQISVSEVQTQNHQLAAAAASNFESSSNASATAHTAPSQASLPQYYTQPFSQFGSTSTGTDDAKRAMPPVNTTPFDSCYAINGLKQEASLDQHRDKRSRLTDRKHDFIARGLVSEDEAMLCFESYFVTFPQPQGDATNVSINSSEENGNQESKKPADRALRLPFRETRSHSSLLLATIISIGARSLSRFATYKATLAEAIALCHDTILCDPGHEPSSLDLKGMMLLSLYNGMPDLMGHGIALSYKFNMPMALLEYEALSEEDKVSQKGQILVRRGRGFLIAFLWTSFYSYCRGLHGFYHIPTEVIRHQLDLLEGSKFAQQPFDRVIRVNVEENLILRQVFDKIGPGMRVARPSYDELYDIVEEGIQALIDWDKRWLDMMEMVTQWGDSSELKTAVPFHHGRQALLMYIFRNMVIDDRARNYPKMREYARMGTESALVLMRWGIESRIWLPHSMVAQYLHHVNIPTAINLLYTTTRLFPEDADFPRIRKLLQRLLKQCDLCIGGNNGTQREVERALDTRAIVLEFDRYAFEIGPTFEDDKTINSQNAQQPLLSLSDGVQGGQDSNLFGEEVTASLRAMSLELNLWGGMLEGALDDVYAVPTTS